MFEIHRDEDGTIVMRGRLDASRVARAAEVLDGVDRPSVVDLAGLDYISSMGLGLLIRTQKRLVSAGGAGLSLVNVTPHVHDVFRYAGFHQIFDIRKGPA